MGFNVGPLKIGIRMPEDSLMFAAFIRPNPVTQMSARRAARFCCIRASALVTI